MKSHKTPLQTILDWFVELAPALLIEHILNYPYVKIHCLGSPKRDGAKLKHRLVLLCYFSTTVIEHISFLFYSSGNKIHKAIQHIFIQKCKTRLNFKGLDISDLHSVFLCKRCQKTHQRTQLTLTQLL